MDAYESATADGIAMTQDMATFTMEGVEVKATVTATAESSHLQQLPRMIHCLFLPRRI